MRDLGRRPPPVAVIERDRFIDTLRAGSVLAVLLGHWTMTTVVWSDGRIIGESALAVVPESHLATWILQVMPLIFFAGGFANARSLERHDGSYPAYLRTRLRRLLQPVLAFVGVWLTIGTVSDLLPLPDPNLLERSADIAALPFWFIGVYLVVVALAPVMLRAHVRWRWGVVVVLIAGAASVDILVYGFGVEAAGFANFAFVWLLPHQLGFFYAERKPDRRGVLWAGAGTGLGTLILLTALFEYPVSLIIVPGAERSNTEPPSLALVAASVWLISAALLLRPLLRRTTARWVDAVNRVPLTMYVWHISALPVAVGVLYPLGFPQHPPGSPSWWLWRPLWIVTLALALAAIVAVVRRFEVHPQPGPVEDFGGATVVVAGVAVIILAVSLLGFGVTGFNSPAADFGENLLGFELNPLVNLIHLGFGLALLTAAYTSRPASITLGVGLILLATGLAGAGDGVPLLATNRASAVVQIGLGAAALAGGIAAGLQTRRNP